jgi:hypothetical protein
LNLFNGLPKVVAMLEKTAANDIERQMRAIQRRQMYTQNPYARMKHQKYQRKRRRKIQQGLATPGYRIRGAGNTYYTVNPNKVPTTIKF